MGNVSEQNETLREVLGAYGLDGDAVQLEPITVGHINSSYAVSVPDQSGGLKRYVLQGISPVAFPRPEELMANFSGITGHLRKKILLQGGDPARESLGLEKTRAGQDFYRDGTGRLWRMTPFVEGSVCLNEATPERFEEAGRAFGRFQWLLSDFPAETLYETIPDFHQTETRLNRFKEALAADVRGRAAGVEEERDFILAREADCSVALNAYREGRLPLRVTHNDTKLNNVLFDEKSGRGLCIIDLDTTMPGLSLYDFGDAIRYGANHCREDEKDLSKVNLDMDLFECYTRGFLEGTRGALTEEERNFLPWGAKLMTLECGIRFLTDYLEGDVYFRISYPEQNLDRCRTQFKLVRDMEAHHQTMQAIVRKYSR